MTGKEVRAFRDDILGLSQKAAALLLTDHGVKCSQKLISDMEKADALSGENYKRAKKLEELARQKNLAAVDRIIEERTAVAPRRFSYQPETFELLQKEIPYRAEAVEVNATLEPADIPGFAKATMDIKFIGLNTLSGIDPLTIDAVGLPDGPNGQPAPLFVELVQPDGLDGKTALRSITFTEDETVKNVERGGLGPHAVSYQIAGADPAVVPEFTVRLRSDYGLRLDKLDAIGFPMYPDLLLRRIKISVTFHWAAASTLPADGEAAGHPPAHAGCPAVALE